jgi:hypothetical protein
MPKKTRATKVTDSRGEKPWLKKSKVSTYHVEIKDKQKTYLIICEGQTEELYFKSFPVVTASVKAVPLGCSTSTLVNCAKEIANRDTYDEVWCVFDMDYKPGLNGLSEDFNNAILMAHAAGFKCAYSNDSFELWFVLHYQYIDQQQLRGFYYELLSKYWKINYERNGKVRQYALSIYKKLMGDPGSCQKRAIDNARKLHQKQKNKAFHLQNPATTVFELVEELNLHLRQ